MRILTRFVIAEFVKVVVIVLAGMTAMIVLFVIGREAIRQGLGLKPIIKLIPYFLPEAMRFAVPGTVLLAATNVYGRMAAAREVLAIKAAGISPTVILWPVYVAAAFISLATVWINDVAVSWGRAGVERVVLESVEEIAYGMLSTQRSYSTGGLTIRVADVQGRTLIEPMITLKASSGRPGGTIQAAEAELRGDPQQGTMTIRLRDATFDFDSEQSGVWPGVEEYVIPIHDFSRRGTGSKSPSELPLREIPKQAVEQQRIIASLQQEIAVHAALSLTTGDFTAMTDASWDQRHRRLAGAQQTLYRLRTEPHRRWANGLSCLCFAIVGAPMAIWRRHGEYLGSFFACFLPILLLYYPFLVLSVDRAKQGVWPPESVWLGNLVLAVCGTWLLRRIIRY